MHNCILFNQIQLLAKHCGKDKDKGRDQKERQIYKFAANCNLSGFIWINCKISEKIWKNLNKSGKFWIYPDKFEKFQITRSLDISLWLQIRVQVHESQRDIFGFLWILLDYFEFYDIGIQGIINVRLNVPVWIQRLVHNFAFFQIFSPRRFLATHFRKIKKLTWSLMEKSSKCWITWNQLNSFFLKLGNHYSVRTSTDWDGTKNCAR